MAEPDASPSEPPPGPGDTRRRAVDPYVFDAKSCGAIVFRAESDGPRYLLLRYAAGHWDFVKGHAEPGETEEETTRRECVEETGIKDLSFHVSWRAQMDYRYEEGGRRVRKLVVYRLARTRVPPDAVRLSDEHTDHTWLSYQEARAKLTYDNAREVLDKANGVLTGSSVTA